MRVPARTVWRSRRRYCGKATSHHTIMSSHYANKCTPNPSKCRPFGWFRRETDRETDREMFGFGFVFFRFLLKNRPKPTDFLVRNRKTDRVIFYFRFTTLAVEMESVRYMRKLEMCRVQEKNLIPYSQYYWYIHVHQM